MNVYLTVVLANVFLTFGNALLGKRLAHLDTLTICVVLWSGKVLVGAGSYGLYRQTSLMEIPWKDLLALFVVGLILGLGELFLFMGLAKDTAIVAVLGCLYPVLLTGFAWMLSGEAPEPRMAFAILLSAAAIYVAAPK